MASAQQISKHFWKRISESIRINERSMTNQKKNKGKEEQWEKKPESVKFRSHTYRVSDINTAALFPPPIFEEVSIKTKKAVISLGVCGGH
jgi:hypothetical protein